MRTDSANTSPGACVHGPRYASANAAVTCTDSPVRSATSRNMPAPVCDTTLRYCAPRKCLPVRNHTTLTSLIIPCRTGTFTAPSAATHRASQKIQASVLRVIGRQGRGAVGTSDRQRRVDTPLGHTGPLESGATVWTCRITPRPSGVIESVLPTASFIATTAKFTDTGQVTSKSLAEQGNTALYW